MIPILLLAPAEPRPSLVLQVYEDQITFVEPRREWTRARSSSGEDAVWFRNGQLLSQRNNAEIYFRAGARRTRVAKGWLTDDGGLRAAMSPSGRRLAVSSSNGHVVWGELLAASPAGRIREDQTRALKPSAAAVKSVPGVAWSPDEQEIAWTVGRQSGSSSIVGDPWTVKVRLRDRKLSLVGPGVPVGWNHDGLWLARSAGQALDLWRHGPGTPKREAHGVGAAAVLGNVVLVAGAAPVSSSPRVRAIRLRQTEIGPTFDALAVSDTAAFTAFLTRIKWLRPEPRSGRRP